jgi:hypothetical protein
VAGWLVTVGFRVDLGGLLWEVEPAPRAEVRRSDPLSAPAAMQAEPEIPPWCARMPGDPEIDRDVKSGEEKLWEACYDNKTEKVEQVLKMLNECVLCASLAGLVCLPSFTLP